MSDKDPSVSDRLRQKELGRPRNKPNFGLIVVLASVVLLLVLATAVFVLHWDARKLLPQKPNPEPNSRLVLPLGAPDRSVA